MIYIRIEMWPRGDKTQAYLLQELVIANTGGDERDGLYKAALSHSTTFHGDGFPNPAEPDRDEIWRRGNGIRHRRRDSPAHLVARALAVLGVK